MRSELRERGRTLSGMVVDHTRGARAPFSGSGTLITRSGRALDTDFNPFVFRL